jgi:two-component system response regulator VicR
MKKIMVVDDEPDLVTITKSRLEANQYAVVTAEDGLEALAKVEAEHPDLILLDLLMPRMNGMEFVKELRQRKDGTGRTPVIVVSARLDMRESFRDGDIMGFISKPFESAVLLAQVADAFRAAGS